MSRYVDLEQKNPSEEDRWYLQQRGELPDDWQPLSIEDISKLRESGDDPLVLPRHADDIPLESIPNTGVVGNQPDAGPEKSALETPAGRLGATYEPETAKARRRAQREQADEAETGGTTKALFGAEPLELDTDVEAEGAKQANERIRKSRASRQGTSVHEQPQEAELRDPEHPANVAEREAAEADQEASQARVEREVARNRRR
jgi:hypothetical protein